jgi:glycosyltransferase involved in cell wall biosynthesis
MISIVIPLYNKEKHIENTIKSVLDQTYRNFELLIINDGSIDNSLEIVQKFNDNRIKIIHKNNSGVASTRNLGIQYALGKLIAFLDADDYWDTEYLSVMINFINNFPNASIYCCNYYIVTKSGKEIKSKNIESGYIVDYFKIALNNPIISSSSVIIPKDTFSKTGVFNENIKNGEDLHLWFRIVDSGNIAFNSTPLAYYNLLQEDNASKDFNRSIKHDILNFINNLNIKNKNWDKFKHNFVARNLKPYYFSDNEKNIVNSIFKMIDFNQVDFKNKFIYFFPNFFIGPVYLYFFKKKYL